MLPIEIQRIFEEYDDSDYWMVLRSAAWGEKLVIEFSIEVQNINDKGEIKQDWTVEAFNPVQCDFTFDWTTSLKISTSEALLWEFIDPKCELYVSGKMSNPEKLFFELNKVHKKLFGNMEVFEMPSFESGFLFVDKGISSGLLTAGPRRLLEQYAICVDRAGLSVNIIEIPQPFGDDRPSISEGLKALILGKSFVIASDFIFSPSNSK